MTRPLLGHGTRAAYVRGCRCLPCRAANAAYAAHRQRMTAYGRPATDMVDAEPVRAHVHRLMAAGMGRRTIMAKSQTSSGQMSKLLGHGKHPGTRRMHADTARRLLDVRLELAPSTPVDATGTLRRLRALVAVGWPQSELAWRLGWRDGNFSSLILGRRPHVLQRTADEVRALYDELWDVAPPAESAGRARRRAAAAGWTGPLSWDDETIDDPAARPDVGRRAADVLDLDEVDHLAEAGASLEEIGRRLGRRPESIEQARRRAARRTA